MVKCKYCQYEWVTKSKMIMVSCPSCLKKIKNEVKVNDTKQYNTKSDSPKPME